jgi:hypothetical protein
MPQIHKMTGKFKKIVGRWVGVWMVGSKSSSMDYLQQSKRKIAF